MNFAYSSLAEMTPCSISAAVPSAASLGSQSVGGSMLILACWKFLLLSYSRGMEQIGALGSSLLKAVYVMRDDIYSSSSAK